VPIPTLDVKIAREPRRGVPFAVLASADGDVFFTHGKVRV